MGLQLIHVSKRATGNRAIISRKKLHAAPIYIYIESSAKGQRKY